MKKTPVLETENGEMGKSSGPGTPVPAAGDSGARALTNEQFLLFHITSLQPTLIVLSAGASLQLLRVEKGLWRTQQLAYVGLVVFTLLQIGSSFWTSYYLGSEAEREHFASTGSMGLSRDGVISVGLGFFVVCTVFFWWLRSYVEVSRTWTSALAGYCLVMVLLLIWLFFY